MKEEDFAHINNIGELKEVIQDLPDETPVYIFGTVLDTVYPVWAKHTTVICQEHNGKTHWKTGLIITSNDNL